MEQQPNLNLPVYVVHPIDGEGHSCTLYKNFMLPISHNLEKDECENAVEGDGSREPTPVPHAEDVFLVNWPADWKAHPTLHQSSANWSAQDQLGWPAQILQMKGSKLLLICLLH